MLREHIQWKGDGTGSLQVRVTPKASANRVRIEERPEGPLVRVDVTVAPEDGKANKQVIKYEGWNKHQQQAISNKE